MKKIITFAFVLMLFLSTVCFANNAPTLTAYVSQPDSDGLCDVTISISGCDFNIFQLALRYDTQSAVPYNHEQQNLAVKFDDFAGKNQINGLSVIGKVLDTQDGVFGFTGYVLPGQEKTQYVSQDGIISCKDAVVLNTFKFKSLDGKAPVIEVARDDGKSFQKSFAQGLAVGCKDVVYKQVDFVYKSKDITTSSEVEYVMHVQMTKQKRLENTVYLQTQNYAFAHDGVLEIIDPEDKNVVPQVIDGNMFVPIRCIAEALGFKVLWEDSNKSITILSDETEYKTVFYIGKSQAMANAENVNLDFNAYIKDGRTFVCTKDVEKLIKDAKVWHGQGLDVVVTTGEKWQEDRQAEKEALSAMMLVVSPFVKIFG